MGLPTWEAPFDDYVPVVCRIVEQRSAGARAFPTLIPGLFPFRERLSRICWQGLVRESLSGETGSRLPSEQFVTGRTGVLHNH